MLELLQTNGLHFSCKQLTLQDAAAFGLTFAANNLDKTSQISIAKPGDVSENP
jgi:hypothetical protein